jgi:hypothetical protein
MDRRLDHKLMALAAAYAVALNFLLPVLGAVLPLAASGGIGLAAMCSVGGVATDRGTPEKPHPVCPCGAACAMPGCGAAALPGGAAVGAGTPPASVSLAGLSPEGALAPAFWPGGSKLARGPPVG